MTTASQLRAIHALRRRLGMQDDDYRAFLEGNTGKRSAKDLTADDANRVVVKLKAMAGQGTTAAQASNRNRATTASGRFAPILQALWIAGWNLGVVREKDDVAMLAFVARQTGLKHTQFLVDPVQAKKAIEALKTWLAREGDVEWPSHRDDPDSAVIAGERGVARKIAVCFAIAKRLQSEGAFKPFVPGTSVWPSDIETYGYRLGLPAGFDHYQGEHWDRLANRLGARLRNALARKSKSVTSEAA